MRVLCLAEKSCDICANHTRARNPRATFKERLQPASIGAAPLTSVGCFYRTSSSRSLGVESEHHWLLPFCCYAVTVQLHGGFTVGRPIDARLTRWLGSLAGLAALNVGLWFWIACFAAPRTPYAETQLLLSGVYAVVCGFRSVFPRVDLERLCLWDTWLSAIILGRAAATIAELCFALQCQLFVQRLSEITATPLVGSAAHAFVPLAIGAELVCWYAVLSLNHIFHAVEESLWALMMMMLSAAFGTAAVTAHGTFRSMMIAGLLVYGVGAALTIAWDVSMYVRRWRLNALTARLTLADGLRDSRHRRHPTQAWHIWREEAPWMTLYFSIGVWMSLAMVLLEAAASRL